MPRPTLKVVKRKVASQRVLAKQMTSLIRQFGKVCDAMAKRKTRVAPEEVQRLRDTFMRAMRRIPTEKPVVEKPAEKPVEKPAEPVSD